MLLVCRLSPCFPKDEMKYKIKINAIDERKKPFQSNAFVFSIFCSFNTIIDKITASRQIGTAKR